MNSIDLAGHGAVITGGARGIGYAIAERMIGSGAAVALWDIDAEGLAEAAKALGALGTVATATVDVADPDSVAAATEATVGALGKIDILVNNAGIAGDNAALWDTPVKEWRRVIDSAEPAHRGAHRV